MVKCNWLLLFCITALVLLDLCIVIGVQYKNSNFVLNPDTATEDPMFSTSECKCKLHCKMTRCKVFSIEKMVGQWHRCLFTDTEVYPSDIQPNNKGYTVYNDPDYVPVGDVAFKLMPNASYTWHEASDACTNNDAFLAVVDTSERKQAVHEIMETAGLTQAWIGLNKGPQEDYPSWRLPGLTVPYPAAPADTSIKCYHYNTPFGREANTKYCSKDLNFFCQREQ